MGDKVYKAATELAKTIRTEFDLCLDHQDTLETAISEKFSRLVEAAQAAETVLILLPEEISKLGLRADNVLPKLKAALAEVIGE